MKGILEMTFDGPKTSVRINTKDVALSDKCMAVDNLLDALNATGNERLLILNTVMKVTILSQKEEDKNESGCFRNQNV